MKKFSTFTGYLYFYKLPVQVFLWFCLLVNLQKSFLNEDYQYFIIYTEHVFSSK